MLLFVPVLALLTGTTSVPPASANRSERLFFDVWGVEDGLPQNSVHSIVQTRDGYVWIATPNGLVRFDGVRFVVFRRGDAPGLDTSKFTRLLEGPGGELWIATEDAGLVYYSHGAFHTYTARDGLPSDTVQRMRIDPDGSLLVQTKSGNAREKGGRFIPERGAFGFPVASGAVWYEEGRQLRRVDQNGSVRRMELTGLDSRPIAGVFEDEEGGVWAWKLPHTVIRWRNEDRTVRTLSLPPHCDVTAVVEDAEHRVWFGFNMGQIFTFHNGEFTQPVLSPEFGSWIIFALYRDKEDGIWAATQDGLFRLRNSAITNPSVQESQGNAGVSVLLRDRRGRTWVGRVPGLSILDNGRLRPFVANHLNEPGWITTLYEDPGGGVWLATYGGKVLHGNGWPTQRIRAREYGVSDSGVNAFLQDRNGTMWMATRSGLVRYGPVPRLYTERDGLRSRDVRALLEDSDGSLWIGGSGGLTHFSHGELRNFTSAEGFPDAQVETLYKDEDGVLWAGTYDRGLIRYAQGRFFTFTTREGLFQDAVYQLIEDRFGNFWIGCAQGIYRVSRRELNEVAAGLRSEAASVAYNRGDGARSGKLSIQCSNAHPGVFKDAEGRLWFATLSGVAIVDPRRVTREDAPPPVWIETSLIDQRAAPASAPLRLVPGQESFEIHYTAPAFTRAEQIRFKYKLEGLDRDWIRAGGRRVAYYSHVPPGSYTFRVMAANADGVWNRTGASLPIAILPPFWRTFWFGPGAAAAMLACLFLLHRRRVVGLQRENARRDAFSRQLIDSQEQERKRIAAELHDGVGQELLIIKNFALLGSIATVTGTTTRERFDEISELASNAIREVRHIAHNLRPHQLDDLGLTQAIRSIAVHAADSSPTVFEADVDPVDGLFDKEAEINLYRIVQESVNNVMKHAGASHARIELRQLHTAVRLTIQDNGRGFTPASKFGFGIKGIMARARLIGSQPIIESSPGKGTTLTLTLPVTEELP